MREIGSLWLKDRGGRRSDAEALRVGAESHWGLPRAMLAEATSLRRAVKGLGLDSSGSSSSDDGDASSSTKKKKKKEK